ncbi:hypothetical protein EIN_176310 [Entamoeba invadens IP1]|uniref:hypothetical protein n=1 Tax=Entamoeba invadens IP1 TaxID=370355 RepID=UPI0002C3D55A|nr:hypothetical protein EIN_176310 [Entamoeba invadens IP1]ELP93814.1 hypothetical protein EIN_176310 [Entamoeba invadens IP1]|eukprot:XP_004260585.1 hypothetical protein EIN_176310 [Entamoeba invadens IP1]
MIRFIGVEFGKESKKKTMSAKCVQEDNALFNEYVNFDDAPDVPDLAVTPQRDDVVVEEKTEQTAQDPSRDIKEEANRERITQLENLSRNMTFEELNEIMVELRNYQRESQVEGMSVPVITDRDFEGIFLMETASDPRYTHSISSGVDVWRRKVNGSTWNGVARAVIPNITPKRMCELYWDYSIRRRWDSFYTVIEDIEILPNGNKVSRTATWTPKLFKQRDYVHVREVIETDNCCVGVYLPAEHNNAPIDNKKFIRGLVNFSGFVFRKQGNDCLCTLMTQTDITIALPDFIITKFIALAIRLYLKLMKQAAYNDHVRQYKA